ncbi:hypothetical protein GY45DRAFT_1434486 [Cubamyces sp. BRFM 1775]|nr:hypothetical protein GY45DRAFT_1434486 [Cubamyces sp. BRFM 1775]
MSRMQQSAAQHCLLISEIVGEICEVLHANGQLKALAQLSQTCKPLHETVVPVLWRHIEGFKPLLKLLPQDTWAEIRCPDGWTPFYLINPDALDWTRYKYYAPFIRSLRWLSSDTISPEALAAVSLHSPYGNALLPRLSKLTWHDSQGCCMAFARMFLTPSIRELNLTVPDHHAPKATAAFFKYARRVCKGVEVLNLNSCCEASKVCPRFPHSNDVSLRLAEWLRALTNLRAFEGRSYLTANCVLALGVLPNLRTVRLENASRQMEAIAAALTSPSAAGKSWFKSVVTLHLWLHQLDGSSQVFLAAVQSTTLCNLLLFVYLPPDLLVARKHMQVCARAAYKHSLRSVTYFVPVLENTNHPSSALPIKTILNPLFALQQITHVAVLVPHFDLDGDTLRAMSEAWPALKKLSILHGFHETEDLRGTSKYVALGDLVHLARNCPDLQDIGLHLDATNAPAVNDAEVQRLLPVPSRCKLYKLMVPVAPIEDPVSVGRFLHRLFPDLRTIVDIVGCMATCDNVIRAGLTPKLRDVHNLVAGLMYNAAPATKHLVFPHSFSGGGATAAMTHNTLYGPPDLRVCGHARHAPGSGA